jgi:hypothetical protein
MAGNAGLLWCLLCAGCLVTGVVIPITAIRHDAKIEVEGIGTLVRSVAARARRRCATLNACPSDRAQHVPGDLDPADAVERFGASHSLTMAQMEDLLQQLCATKTCSRTLQDFSLDVNGAICVSGLTHTALAHTRHRHQHC